MQAILEDLKTNFQDHADIVSAVGTKCSFLTELQETTPPFITYNVQENETETKDGSVNYSMVILVVAKNITDLISIYDVARETMLLSNSSLYPSLQGSSFPERVKEWDDNYIIDLTINLNK